MIFLLFISLCSSILYAGDYSFYFCAKTSEDFFADILPKKAEDNNRKESYILMAFDNETIDFSPGDNRATVEGKAYILKKSLLEFDMLSIMTMKNDETTDIITYLGKNNKLSDLLFYSDVTKTSDKDNIPALVILYISKNGLVYRLYMNEISQKECLGKYPEWVTNKLSFN